MKVTALLSLAALGILCAPASFAATAAPAADAPALLALAFGSSLPANLQADAQINPRGPSRESGGEIIDIKFKSAKYVSSVQLSGFSSSGRGQVLVHNAEATSTGANGDTTFALGEFFSFVEKGNGLYNNYQGNVMLENNNYVSTNVGQTVTELKFQLEGFSNDDATALIQISTTGGVNYYDFTVSRLPVQVGHPGHPIHNPAPPATGAASYQWVGASCDLVTPEGYVVSSGYPAGDCGGASYQWVQASCDLVTPEGYVVSSGYEASDCGGASYQWVESSCDLVTPDGYVVSSGYPAGDCGGASYQWVGASCDLVTPDGYVVSSGYPAGDCGVN